MLCYFVPYSPFYFAKRRVLFTSFITLRYFAKRKESTGFFFAACNSYSWKIIKKMKQSHRQGNFLKIPINT